MISAIRPSGESSWSGTPSKRLLDAIERKQEESDSEFLDLLRNAIVEVDKKKKQCLVCE